MREKRWEKIAAWVIAPLIVGVVLLLVEYRTGLFRSAVTDEGARVSEDTQGVRSATEIVTPVGTAGGIQAARDETAGTGEVVAVEASETVTVSEASAISLFDGALTIAVSDASRYSNRVSAVVSSPGFEGLKIETEQVGYKGVYETNARYEVQIMGAADGAGLQNSTAAFRVVRLGGFSPAGEPVAVEASETVTVSEASAVSLFDGALTIAVSDASRVSNRVSAVISSPGFGDLGIEMKQVGYKSIYETNARYEVQIMGATDGGGLQNSTATFIVRRLGH